MIVTRLTAGHTAILDRQLHARARVELSDCRAINLLPWRLTRPDRRHTFVLAARDLFVGNQHVALPGGEVEQPDRSRARRALDGLGDRERGPAAVGRELQVADAAAELLGIRLAAGKRHKQGEK